MALWPFRRKSRRKRSVGSLSGGEAGLRARDAGVVSSPPRTQTEADVSMTAAAATAPKQQLKKQNTEPAKLHRRQRAYSFSPGRNDSIRVDRQKSRRNQRTSRSRVAGANPVGDMKEDYGVKGDSGDSALGEDIFARAPTLHSKRDGEHLPRRKSSKRRKADHQREAEIKAMSNFMPLRPATEDWTAGRPMRKDTRRVRTGFGLGFRNSNKQDWDAPSSDVSLPIPESLHSSLSSDSDHIEYKVSAFEALAPRPTLRYAVYPRWTAPGSAGDDNTSPMRNASQRRRLSDRAPIPESTLKAHKRVHDLANDLSASDLRELMERDQRRREQKRQKEQDKIERRLARRVEKQKAEEAAAAREGRDSPPNMERGVLGRDSPGLGSDPTSAVVTSSKRRPSASSPRQLEKRPEGAKADDEERSVSPRPLDVFHRTNSIVVETPLSPEAPEIPETIPELPSKSKRFMRTRHSWTKSPPRSEEAGDTSDTAPKGSESSSSKNPMSWTSIFRWANRAKRNSGPSSFSNTSRDSMQTPQLPTPTAPIAFPTTATGVPRKLSSTIPKRTRSRFREDLPELPLSPPESPEPVPRIEEASPDLHELVEPVARPSSYDEHRGETPTSGHRSIEDGMRYTPTSFSHREDIDPSPAPQSMSLASIDSEGSWLSGRMMHRRSSGVPEASLRSPRRHRESGSSNSHDHETMREDGSVADDEYLSQFAEQGEENANNRKSVGEGRPSSDGEDNGARWGSVKGRQPIVHEINSTVRSREGLLNSFNDESAEAAEQEQEHEPEEAESPVVDLQRATSINLGKSHARNFSAGSAKLLNLTPRNSVDGKRRSVDTKH